MLGENLPVQHSVWRENRIWCFNSFSKFCSILSEGKTVSGVSMFLPNFAAFCLKGKLCLVFQCSHQILQHSVWRENRVWCFNSFTKFCSILSEGKIVSGVSILSPNFFPATVCTVLYAVGGYISPLAAHLKVSCLTVIWVHSKMRYFHIHCS